MSSTQIFQNGGRFFRQEHFHFLGRSIQYDTIYKYPLLFRPIMLTLDKPLTVIHYVSANLTHSMINYSMTK